MKNATRVDILKLVAVLFLWTVPSLAQTTHTVILRGLDFVPADISIDVGDTVHWVWESGFHNVESGVIEGGIGVPDENFRSGDATALAGTTFDFLFDQTFLDARPEPDNSYQYYCVIHTFSGMKGTITVVQGGCTSDLECDDDLFCNGGESCDATLDCQPGSDPCPGQICDEDTDTCKNCLNNSDCDDEVGCTDDTCNAGTDSCDHIANNANCDDTLFCNGGETCDATLDCQAGTDPCPGQTCDEDIDTCNGCIINGDCNDGLFCNGAEACVGGSCQTGTAPNCDDDVDCTDDSCNEATDSCDHIANNANCDDGLFCNGSESCDATLDCQTGSDPCPDQNCIESTDTCNDCITDGDCDDGLFCNGAEACVGGSCQTGTAANCDDDVGCTDDSCNTGTDSCDNIAVDDNCANGVFCDGAETCHATLDCQAGTPPTCDDGEGCTDDSCDVATDSCDHIANDANCSDGLFCNGQESCVDGACAASVLPCDPGQCDEVNDVCTDPEQPQTVLEPPMCGACGPTGPAAILTLFGLFVFRFLGPRTGRSRHG